MNVSAELFGEAQSASLRIAAGPRLHLHVHRADNQQTRQRQYHGAATHDNKQLDDGNAAAGRAHGCAPSRRAPACDCGMTQPASDTVVLRWSTSSHLSSSVMRWPISAGCSWPLSLALGIRSARNPDGASCL